MNISNWISQPVRRRIQEMPYAAPSTQDFSPSSLPGSTRPSRCYIHKVLFFGNFLSFKHISWIQSLLCSVSVNLNPAPCHCHCYCFHFCSCYCSFGNFSFLCEQRHCYRKAIKVLSTEKCLPSFHHDVADQDHLYQILPTNLSKDSGVFYRRSTRLGLVIS